MIDAEIIGMAKRLIQGIEIRDQPIAVDIMRQVGHAIPFDIGTIKIFEYEYLDEDGISESKGLIAKILAVAFLVGIMVVDSASPWTVPISAVGDAVMALVVYVVHRRRRASHPQG